MSTIKLGIVGVGKIATDQHLPAITANGDFQLLASASRNATVPGLPGFKSIDEMLAQQPEINAVALCMPPQHRYQAAHAALSAGKHVFMEKPPGATLSEVVDLEKLAQSKGVSLLASWHSRHAPAVQVMKSFLKKNAPRKVAIIWMEDVRHWHPGQEWIWEAGGLGVFDPGINALSIITEILPNAMFLKSGVLEFPANRDAPIAADLRFTDAHGLAIHAQFDWRQTGKQSWDIIVTTDAGVLRMADGGAKLWLDDVAQQLGDEGEYPSLYRHFAALIKTGQSDVDLSPLRHVADAFMLGQRKLVEDFDS
jgi:D-galactose 1-dehydrogenase